MVKYLGILLGCAALMVGCSDLNNETFDGMDGNAGIAAMEIAQAGKTVMEAAEEGNLIQNTTKAAADTIPYTTTWSYDAANGRWIGHTVAYPENGTVTREDTIKFTDASGAAVDTPVINKVDKVEHTRSSTYVGNGGLNVVIDVESIAQLNSAKDKATLNGTGNCALQSVPVASTQVTDVVFPKATGTDKKWDYPESGSVYIDRPFRTIDITFTGGTTAQATVTNKVNSKTHTFNVDLVTGAETE